MALTAGNKQNIPKSSTAIKLPRDFLGTEIKTGKANVYDGLTTYARFMLAVIHTMNKAVKGYCKITYDDFISRLGGSKETVSRNMDILEARGIIEKLGKSRYKILTPYGKKYTTVYDYLHKAEWEMTFEENGRQKTVKKRLKRNAVLALSYVCEMNANEKADGLYISSHARLGKALNLPRTTVGGAQREIVGAGLCECELVTTDEYGAHKKGLTKYEAAEEARAVKLSSNALKSQPAVKDKAEPKQTEREKRKQEVIEAGLRAKIDIHYSTLRQAAEMRAEAVQRRADADSEYRANRKELNELSMRVAFEKDAEKAKRIDARISETERALEKRLQELGIDKSELKPHYRCSECSDTGYLPTGQPCECLKKLIKSLKQA